MPKVTVTVPHSHPPDEVVQRAGPYIEKIVDDFQGSDLEIEWVDHKADFSFTSLTFTIKGNVDVTPEDITVIVELPFAAMIFKDKVEKALNKNLTRAVSDEEAPDGEE
ncbi:MAG: polyhydroxyalkanoic acid system family protein [Planctomycetota bacterium]